MGKLNLTIATGHYDRIDAIRDGRIAIEGCEISYLCMKPEEIFHRALRHHEFDLAELSFASYMIAVSREIHQYIAVPVFLSRAFRHSSIYIRNDAGISSPQDLKGKRIGAPVYAQTAGLWVRGMLADQYGIEAQDVTWVTGGLENPGRVGNIPVTPHPSIRMESLAADDTLSSALSRGDIAGLISARPPSCFIEGHTKIERMFPDYRAAERDYFAATGLFPIMHVLGIRKDLAVAHPWLPASIYKAFLNAKQMAVQELQELTALKVSLPWGGYEASQTVALMGEDYWRYGFENNLAELNAMTRWLRAQGLVDHDLDPRRLFHPGTLEQARI